MELISLFLSTITTSTDYDCVTTYQVSVSGVIMLVNDNLREILYTMCTYVL